MHCQANPILFALILGLAGAAAPCPADDLAEKGRDIFNKNQQTVVTVQVGPEDDLFRRGQDERDPAGDYRHGPSIPPA